MVASAAVKSGISLPRAPLDVGYPVNMNRPTLPSAATSEPGKMPVAVPISVIVPAIDEAETIEAMLATLAPLRARGSEVIVVDGGSRDDTAERATAGATRVIHARPGRAAQMNAGAAVATGELLWFLHADTKVDEPVLAAMEAAAHDPGVSWGRVGVRLDSWRPLLRLTAVLMNIRSRLTGIATGDQGIFVRRVLFDRIGGFPEQPLMEDVEISARLKVHAAPRCLPTGLTTSARRWERHGVIRTILLMWSLRLAYWRGADPAELAARYRDG